MRFLEKDLEDIICEALKDPKSKSLLVKRGLHFLKYPILHRRQLRIGNYGISDIIVIHRHPNFRNQIHVNVIELKKDVIDSAAVSQCSRYMKGVSRYLDKRGIGYSLSGTLIGSNIDRRNNFVHLMHNVAQMSVFTYSYGLEGIEFEEVEFDYHLIDEGF